MDLNSIDINCDMGESYGNYIIGQDAALMPLVDSCNIACGFHGGDPYHIECTIELALKHQVRIGAHPSYPDRNGFGRRYMKINSNELKSIIKYQISALKGITESKGSKLSYVKPHGALYNKMATDIAESQVVIEAILEFDSTLSLMGLANSKTAEVAEKMNIRFIPEGFGDRRYHTVNQLQSRSIKGSVITDEEKAVNQIVEMGINNRIQLMNNEMKQIKVETICVHGDNPSALKILQSLRQKII